MIASLNSGDWVLIKASVLPTLYSIYYNGNRSSLIVIN